MSNYYVFRINYDDRFKLIRRELVNHHLLRQGWGTYVKEPKKQPDYFYGGVLPEEKRVASGHTVTTGISINHLALSLIHI